MRIVLILLFLTIHAFGASLEQSYEKLNNELNKASLNLTLEDKVKLYFLVQSTHEKITTSISLGDPEIKSLDDIEKKTLTALSNLNKNSKLTKKQIQNIKTLYSEMKTNGQELLKQRLHEKKTGEKIIYKDKIIYEEKPKRNSAIISLVISSILSILLGIVIGFFIYDRYLNIKQQDTTSKFIIEDLKNENTNLQYIIENLRDENEKLQEKANSES